MQNEVFRKMRPAGCTVYTAKGDAMKKKTRRIINIVLIAVLVVGIVYFSVSQWTYYESRRDYQEALQITDSTEPVLPATQAVEEAPAQEPTEALAPEAEAEQENQAQLREVLQNPTVKELLQIDLDALREVNEDVIGWIHIPDTVISYPLLHWTDNDFYLNHTWMQTKNSGGAIFMECENEPDFSDFNTIIYGHNLLDDSMFGGLSKYKNEEYAKEHPSIYIVTDRGVFCYDVFAAHRVGIDTIMYATDLTTEYRKEEFLRFTKEYSRVDLGKEPAVRDKILTLSTCSGGHDARWVVQGMLVESKSYSFPET